MVEKKKEPNEDRQKLLRQAYEAIKIMPDEKLKEIVPRLQKDSGIKFR